MAHYAILRRTLFATLCGMPATTLSPTDTTTRLAYLEALERKVLWLAVWMIHNANHLRESAMGSRWEAIRRPRRPSPR